MNSRFRWKQIVLALVIAIVIAMLVCLVYFWDFYYDVDSPLLTSIIAGLVIVTATILGIDRLLAHREELRWKKAKFGVLMELATCLNSISTTVRTLAGIDYKSLGLPSREGLSYEEWFKRANEIDIQYWAKKSDPLAQDIVDHVKNCGQHSWNTFLSGIQFTILELDRIVAMYPIITSQPDLVHKIVDVRKSINDLWAIRSTFPDILGIPIGQQPTPQIGDKQSTSDWVHGSAIQSLNELVISIINAKKTVGKLLFE